VSRCEHIKNLSHAQAGLAPIGGIPVTVASDAECERADYVVCVLWDGPKYFLDDQKGSCCRCFRAVRFRPCMPKKPPTICVECVDTPCINECLP
jgi:hypothetical protein